MPKEFTNCVKNGGKVVTEKLGKGKYRHVCYDKNNKRFPGEVKTSKKSKANRNRAQIKESRDLVEELHKLQQYFNDNHHSI